MSKYKAITLNITPLNRDIIAKFCHAKNARFFVIYNQLNLLLTCILIGNQQRSQTIFAFNYKLDIEIKILTVV